MQRSVQARKRARSGDGLCVAGIHVRIISKNVASWIDTGSWLLNPLASVATAPSTVSGSHHLRAEPFVGTYQEFSAMYS